MPPKTTTPECDCGPLKPQKNDQELEEGTDANQILGKIQLLCDDNTGVFFFRYNQSLYLRVVEME